VKLDCRACALESKGEFLGASVLEKAKSGRHGATLCWLCIRRGTAAVRMAKPFWLMGLCFGLQRWLWHEVEQTIILATCQQIARAGSDFMLEAMGGVAYDRK